MPRYAVWCAVLALGAAGAEAQGNLRKGPAAPAAQQVMTEMRMVPQLLHNGTPSHLAEVEASLRPIFAALPKDNDGHVVHRVARYALVRYFLVHRGWYIKGLARAGAVWNEFPADSVFESHFPRMILQYVEHTLHRPQLSLQDLVSIVAAVETLVHSNVEDVLMLVYDALGLPVDQPLRDAEQEQTVLKLFAAFMFQPSTQQELGSTPVAQFLEDLRNGDYYGKGFWADVDLFAADSGRAARQRLTNPFSSGRDFASMVTLAESISAGMGNYQQAECQAMKHTMMDMSGGESGRLSLADFYRPYRQGDRWEFSESARYLDFIGALEPSADEQHRTVLIPNYVGSWGNCLESSSFHQVCCVNECERLLMRLELALPRPFVQPEELARVVTGIPSDTVAAPWNMSAPLRARLHEIAGRNNGAVPLHGRMFSEWMSRAYPNECPLPVDTSARKGTFDEKDKLATKEERDHIIGQDEARSAERAAAAEAQAAAGSAAEAAGEGPDELAMPWSEVEELLADQDWGEMKATDKDKAAAGAAGWGRSILRAIAVLAVVAATAARLLPSGRSLVSTLLGRRVKEKTWLP